jgi:hypothetical protein
LQRAPSRARGLLRPGPRPLAHPPRGRLRSGPRQPGPGPRIPLPAWAKRGPVTLGRTAAARSRSTATRRFRGNKTPSPFDPPNPNPFHSPRSPGASFCPRKRASERRPAGGGCGGSRGGSATVRRLAGARVHRKVNGSPSRCLSVVPEGDGAKARVGLGSGVVAPDLAESRSQQAHRRWANRQKPR